MVLFKEIHNILSEALRLSYKSLDYGVITSYLTLMIGVTSIGWILIQIIFKILKLNFVTILTLTVASVPR